MAKKQIIEARAVASCLTRFMFVKDFEDFKRVYNEIYKFFDLRDDPFTGCPVIPEDYAEQQEDYRRQLSEERFGYDIFSE